VNTYWNSDAAPAYYEQVWYKGGLAAPVGQCAWANAYQDDASPQPGDSGVIGQSIEGLTVTPITSALRQRYAIPNDMEGVVVTAVAPRSEAGKMRLPVGTVIQRANNRVVRSEADLKAAMDEARAAGRPGVFLLIRVQGTNSSVVLPFAKSE